MLNDMCLLKLLQYFQIISSVEQRRRTSPKWKPCAFGDEELHHRFVVSVNGNERLPVLSVSGADSTV
jgi:hypothetical protein